MNSEESSQKVPPLLENVTKGKNAKRNSKKKPGTQTTAIVGKRWTASSSDSKTKRVTLRPCHYYEHLNW